MKLTKNNLIKKLGITDRETIDIIVKYNKLLPILNETGEGFCISARDLHRELVINSGKVKKDGTIVKGREFSKWIKGRIEKYDFEEQSDYVSYWVKDGLKFSDSKKDDALDENSKVKKDDALDENNVKQMSGAGYSLEYFLTLECAKQLAMVENNDVGKIARKYFIKVEKILLEAVKWDKVRKPERENYKIMCSELKNYLMRNFEKEPKFYDYSNEADAINKICLGATARQIREYIEAQDENTREWLTAKENEYIDFIQNLNIMYLRMNLNKELRYNLIQQGFTAMYPNASFLIVNKEIIDSKFKI